ncbi:hypothetical protein AC579_10200 [Pseudocercospora musae]|uniref:Uncharacterized protein n=1 Tax=Pseudocercospora musae TaxID=113226 RepID=A0A139I3G7_9PEZI|nr:hypothetical protein AC579_10200 [Pseudocercospora musae]
MSWYLSFNFTPPYTTIPSSVNFIPQPREILMPAKKKTYVTIEIAETTKIANRRAEQKQVQIDPELLGKTIYNGASDHVCNMWQLGEGEAICHLSRSSWNDVVTMGQSNEHILANPHHSLQSYTVRAATSGDTFSNGSTAERKAP